MSIASQEAFFSVSSTDETVVKSNGPWIAGKSFFLSYVKVLGIRGVLESELPLRSDTAATGPVVTPNPRPPALSSSLTQQRRVGRGLEVGHGSGMPVIMKAFTIVRICLPIHTSTRNRELCFEHTTEKTRHLFHMLPAPILIGGHKSASCRHGRVISHPSHRLGVINSTIKRHRLKYNPQFATSRGPHGQDVY